MNAFVLKIIACIAMFIDHIGYAIFNGNPSYLNYIGRISFPIFPVCTSTRFITPQSIAGQGLIIKTNQTVQVFGG